MAGKRLENPQKPRLKITFANMVIALCLAVSLAVTAAVVYEYHRLGEVMPAGVVTALLGLWGGELLIVAARQVLGSDAIIRHDQKAPGTDVNGTGSV